MTVLRRPRGFSVRVVGEEIKRLSNLVTEFLDFARPRPLVKRPTSMIALVLERRLAKILKKS